MKTAIVGGGAAGFFAAIQLKCMSPGMQVVVLERSHRVLSKVEISGGGRCNCTNTFADVKDLSSVYPRGHRLMKRLFNVFSPSDAYRWFEAHGVRLTTQADQCVFPASQDSHTIINCFLDEARTLGVEIRMGIKADDLALLRSEYDFVVITTGGSPNVNGYEWLAREGVEIVPPVPSLFTFRINDASLQALMGTVVEEATVSIPGTKFRANGPLLVTHWGVSGPAILKLSSYAARTLQEQHYEMPLCINWLSANEEKAAELLATISKENVSKQTANTHPQQLPARLWQYLSDKALGARAQLRWRELGRKDMNRLANVLYNDNCPIGGRAPFKDEFVTCGGVSLSSVSPSTLESKLLPRLFFAGEVLDIDGITGGFNFQAAWTTAYTVAQAIANSPRQ